MTLLAGTEILITPEKPVAGGRMLARHEGQVVLVARAIPGERVRARVPRTTRGLAEADLAEVIDASPDRRPVTNEGCGGAAYAHIAYQRQQSLKAELVADAFARIGKVALNSPVPVMPSREDG